MRPAFEFMSQKLDLITLHGMVELAPPRVKRKENTINVTKETKVASGLTLSVLESQERWPVSELSTPK